MAYERLIIEIGVKEVSLGITLENGDVCNVACLLRESSKSMDQPLKRPVLRIW